MSPCLCGQGYVCIYVLGLSSWLRSRTSWKMCPLYLTMIWRSIKLLDLLKGTISLRRYFNRFPFSNNIHDWIKFVQKILKWYYVLFCTLPMFYPAASSMGGVKVRVFVWSFWKRTQFFSKRTDSFLKKYSVSRRSSFLKELLSKRTAF